MSKYDDLDIFNPEYIYPSEIRGDRPKPVEEKKGAVEGFVDDTVIESKINALLIDAKGVNVTNFRWRSNGGHVFLFGRALSEAELEKAIAVVKGIKNVTAVTSRVKVRPKR